MVSLAHQGALTSEASDVEDLLEKAELVRCWEGAELEDEGL